MEVTAVNTPAVSAISHDETRPLARVAVERDIVVISDDIWKRVICDSATPRARQPFSWCAYSIS